MPSSSVTSSWASTYQIPLVLLASGRIVRKKVHQIESLIRNLQTGIVARPLSCCRRLDLPRPTRHPVVVAPQRGRAPDLMWLAQPPLAASCLQSGEYTKLSWTHNSCLGIGVLISDFLGGFGSVIKEAWTKSVSCELFVQCSMCLIMTPAAVCLVRLTTTADPPPPLLFLFGGPFGVCVGVVHSVDVKQLPAHKCPKTTVCSPAQFCAAGT